MFETAKGTRFFYLPALHAIAALLLATPMSAFRGKVDRGQRPLERPQIAFSGRSTPYPNPIPYGQTFVPTFTEALSSAIIGPSLRGHLGNVGTK
jgi:hypothetical protein